FFDVVVAASIFTHLSMKMQVAWLEELRRIMKPGGLVIASLHGRFAATVSLCAIGHRLGLGAWGARLASAAALASGFLALPDHSRLLKGVAPNGHYKTTFQTSDHTMRAFSESFEVLEYLEAALGFQDLVVMRN